jgi:hypothetical protein
MLAIRRFSNLSRLRKYADNKHLQTVGQGKRLELLNVIEEGVNEINTDYTKPYGKQQAEALKPI